MASGPEPTIPISQADDIIWNDTKEIIALKEYTDQYISLYQGEIRNVGYELANRLITQGIVAEHDETESGGGSSSGSSSGGAVIVEVTDQQQPQDEGSFPIFTLSVTWNEIEEAVLAGKNVYLHDPSAYLTALDSMNKNESLNIYGIKFANYAFSSNSKNSNNYYFSEINDGK